MLYLNKLLCMIKSNPAIFKSQDIILALGLTSTHIKNLKKHALENQLITQEKQNHFLTKKGEDYLVLNPMQKWNIKSFSLQEDLNTVYLREEKTPSVLTKAIRNLAKHLIENAPLKDSSIEQGLTLDLKKCNKILSDMESYILSGKNVLLENLYEKYYQLGLTKSLISILLLKVLVDNLDKIAIYEKAQFQLKFDTLMFDRMVICPQNFEIQMTVLPDEYILKNIAKIILNKKSDNILEITKGLYTIIKSLDKYTINTQNLTTKTLRLRNVIFNAKDPISLFEKDIPKVFGYKQLKDCNREFLNDLKISLNELKQSSTVLIKDLKSFILKSFNTKSKEDLSSRFSAIREYIGDKDLKFLYNTCTDTNVTDELWTNRFATFINQSRVPKDWSDKDYADFKVKTKELALKFFTLEATLGTTEKIANHKFYVILNDFLKLSKAEQMMFLRKAVNV